MVQFWKLILDMTSPWWSKHLGMNRPKGWKLWLLRRPWFLGLPNLRLAHKNEAAIEFIFAAINLHIYRIYKDFPLPRLITGWYNSTIYNHPTVHLKSAPYSPNKGSQKWPRLALYTVPVYTVYTVFIKCLHIGLKINDDMQTISTNMDSNQVSWAINGGRYKPAQRCPKTVATKSRGNKKQPGPDT